MRELNDGDPEPRRSGSIAEREARLQSRDNGETIGIMVFVSGDELYDMGLGLDRPSITYRIVRDGITFE